MLTRLSLVAFIVSLVMLALASPARSDAISDCNSSDPVRRIAGCSKLIATGFFDDRQLAFIYQNRAIAFFTMGASELALADFTTAIQLSPKSDAAFLNRGNAYLRLRRLDEARNDFDAALARNPQLADALANRGLVLLLEGRFAAALEDLDQAIALKPAFPTALNSRGVVFEKMGLFDRAIEDYQKALEIDPDFPIARINLNRLTHRVNLEDMVSVPTQVAVGRSSR